MISKDRLKDIIVGRSTIGDLVETVNELVKIVKKGQNMGPGMFQSSGFTLKRKTAGRGGEEGKAGFCFVGKDSEIIHRQVEVYKAGTSGLPTQETETVWDTFNQWVDYWMGGIRGIAVWGELDRYEIVSLEPLIEMIKCSVDEPNGVEYGSTSVSIKLITPMYPIGATKYPKNTEPTSARNVLRFPCTDNAPMIAIYDYQSDLWRGLITPYAVTCTNPCQS